MLENQLFKNLKAELLQSKDWFVQAIQTIQNEEVSNYPIVVAYPKSTSIEIGINSFSAELYSYNLSTLEELAMKKVVHLENIDDFRKLYKKHTTSICVFLIDKPAPQFVFVPLTD